MAGRVPEIQLTFYGFILNLAWEFAHTPFYRDANSPVGYLLWTRLHCTVGDVMILLSAFWVAAVTAGSRQWWKNPRPWIWTSFIVAGVGYTMFSEWRNTAGGAWAYSPSMPLLFGLGLTPLVQWLIVPVLAIKALQRRALEGA
jgi:hypothetical protein